MAIDIGSELSGSEVISHARRVKCGFLNDCEVARIAADPLARLQVLMVRCHGGRFIAPAQDVKHFIELVERGGEMVRDVSVYGGGV